MSDNSTSRSICLPRITFFIVHLGVGGAQKVAAFVMNELVAAGYSVSVVCYWDIEERVGLSPEVSRSFLLNGDDNRAGFGFAAKAAEKGRVVRRLSEELDNVGTGCAVAFGPDPFLLPAICLSKFKGHLVCCERGWLGARNGLYQLMLKKLMRRADIDVFQFDGAKDSYGGSLASDVRIIPNVCRPSSVAWVGPDLADNYVVGAGRLVPDKGFATLIRAFSLLEDDDVKLKIYGDGPDRSRLEALVSELHLEGRVIFPGVVSDYAALAASSRLFVLSSQYEGVPNSLIEAMCAGIPVVATDCKPGGARFLTRDGTIGGPIVPIDDEFALARAIHAMLSDSERAARLGEAGRILVTDYSSESIAVMWLELFANLLDGDPTDDLR